MIGQFLVLLAFVLALFSAGSYYVSHTNRKDLLRIARLCFHGMAMIMIIISAYFLFLIVTHQYNFKYIFENNSREMPLGYMISSFWAGQEGSFLFWAFLSAVIGVFLQNSMAKKGELESSVMFVYSLVAAFLILMIIPSMKDPFASIWSDTMYVDGKYLNQAFLGLPALQSFLFEGNDGGMMVQMSPNLLAALKSTGISESDFITNGRGLNPLLQNFWMQIHPPILFVGFALSGVPFALSIGYSLKKKYQEWVKPSLPWMLLLGSILGLGIMMGGYWAYGVLGWGGYWAWDPVENASLVPWVVAVALIHTMVVQIRTETPGTPGRYARVNTILTPLVFALVIYSTFLTRSGILAESSVHSFPESNKEFFYILLIGNILFLVLPYFVVLRGWKAIAPPAKEPELLSRELTLYLSMFVLNASALIIFFGTSWPWFTQNTVEVSFYNNMHMPLIIIMGILNALSLIVKWNKTDRALAQKQLLISLSISIVLSILIIVLSSMSDILLMLIIFSSLFNIAVNGEVVYRVLRGDKTMAGGYIAHIGFSIFLLGVVGSSAFDAEAEVDLPRGETVQALGFTLQFADIIPFENNQRYKFLVNVTENGSTTQIMPIMYTSTFNNQIMREPDISSSFTKDIYISPLGYSEGEPQTQEAGAFESMLELNGKYEFDGAVIEYKEYSAPEKEVMKSGSDYSIVVSLLISKGSYSETVKLSLDRINGAATYKKLTLDSLGWEMQLTGIEPAMKRANVRIVSENPLSITAPPKEILSIKISTKPYISFVWIGVLLITAGFIVASYRRSKGIPLA